MIISFALIACVAFGKIGGIWLLLLFVTWLPDVSIIALLTYHDDEKEASINIPYFIIYWTLALILIEVLILMQI